MTFETVGHERGRPAVARLGARKAAASTRAADTAVRNSCLISAELHLRTALRYWAVAGEGVLLDVVECLTLLGIVLARLNKFQDAEKALRDCIALSPGQNRDFRQVPLFVLWKMLLRQRRFDEANAVALQMKAF